MKQFQILFVITLFTLLSACSSLKSNQDNHDSQGFWGTSSGKNWKTGFNTCWKTIAYTSDQGCHGETKVEQAEVSGIFWPDDQDRDGVFDSDDMCPFTPEGVQIENNGCAIDSDADGVPNYLDECSATSMPAIVDTNGCVHSLLTLDGNVHFNFDSSTLTNEAKRILDNTVSVMKANSNTSFIIEGYTDSDGSETYNQQLSEERAKAIMKYLVSQGISASRMTAIGKGENYPVASNDSPEGKKQNRRAVIISQ